MINKNRKGTFFACIIVTVVFGFAESAMAVQFGPLKVGGAIRANYIYGDYENNGSDAPQRGDQGGDFELDTFRVNLDLAKKKWLGKVEYRWYDGYNFLHTGWFGYDFGDAGQIQVGLNRVPFGVGSYGPANSWFFDQHYYVGLSDDMDYGVKYSRSFNKLGVDIAYYLTSEHSFMGASSESARYSYDIVDAGTPYSHYEERHQVNLRSVYSLDTISLPTDVGLSLQWGKLDADERFANDSNAYAVSIHSKTTAGPWALMLQLTGYKYDANYKDTATDANGARLTNDLIVMGAYDFAWPVASEGIIPSAALSYTWKPDVDWLDSVTFYENYSVILKNGKTTGGKDFNDSAMNIVGMAFAKGGWYIYVDYAYSNGNYFVGNEGDVYDASFDKIGDFGVNGNNRWESRFNINFGYYF